ncbi:MAG: type III pantothenate kinase, partial [Bacteroidetes bacterium]|nr:type III pantothenate kinase [Bacteroidota bacterium]
ANESKEVSDYLTQHFRTTVFTAETPIPIRNNYRSPETLGIDRLATAVGGAAQYPNQNLLIIDAGSAITYDFIDKDQGFMGGSISPGLAMRFQALNTFTENLPLVQQQTNVELTENTTEMGISAGVQNGVIAEMDGIIDRYRSKYDDLQIIATGGDLNFFNDKLKNHIFADSFLLLKGLNKVMEYNA